MDDVSATIGSSPFAASSAAAILSLRKGDKMVNSFRFWLTTSAVFLIALPDTGQACSLAQVSLYEQFSKHSRVFLGTVRERIKEPVPGQGVYTIFVDEAFKGLPDKGKGSGEIEVTLSESEQCGLGRPQKNGRILIFMNEGDVVNTTSHSRLIWLEAVQKEANLNPVMDDLVTLRRMLFPKNQKGIAPDEDTALHQALKVLIPVFGRAEVSKQMPFKTTYLANRPNSDDRVWRIKGTPNCPNKKTEPCRNGSYGADVNKWSGNVVRVFKGD